MKTMIGVMGSVADYNLSASEVAYKLGQAIAEAECIVVTGACPGLPYDAVCGAKDAGGMTVGISPGHNFAEHTIKYSSPSERFDVLIYTGSGLMGREITGVRSCDIVVLIGGRSGTLGEFAIAYDEGKLIGVLTGTGGISDHITKLVEVINKDTGAQVIYHADPKQLIESLMALDRSRRAANMQHGYITAEIECPPDNCKNINIIEEAIEKMEQEVLLLQANMVEQRRRLESFRDLATMGPGERGR